MMVVKGGRGGKKKNLDRNHGNSNSIDNHPTIPYLPISENEESEYDDQDFEKNSNISLSSSTNSNAASSSLSKSLSGSSSSSSSSSSLTSVSSSSVCSGIDSFSPSPPPAPQYSSASFLDKLDRLETVMSAQLTPRVDGNNSSNGKTKIEAKTISNDPPKISRPPGRPPKKRIDDSQDLGSETSISTLTAWNPDFHRAAQYGQVKTLETMLRKGQGHLESRDSAGNTVLHAAAAWGQADAVRMLLRAGADTEALNTLNQTAQGVARTAELASLIGEFSERRRSWNGHRHQSLWKAIWLDQERDIVFDQPDDSQDSHGNGWLHLAAMMDKAKVIREICRKGRRQLNRQNTLGNTALHDAVRYGSLGAIEALLDLGADWRVRNGRGERSLDIWGGRQVRKIFRRHARKSSDGASLLAALEGAEAKDDDSDSEGGGEDSLQSSSMLADKRSSLRSSNSLIGLGREERKMQQMLAILERLQEEARRNTQSTTSGSSSTTIGIKRSSTLTRKRGGSAETIIPKSPPLAAKSKEMATVWGIDKTTGRTALHRLASRGGPETRIKELLEQHPALITCTDHGGYTPLHEAALKGRLEVVRLLLRFASSQGTLQAICNAQAENGDTPLHDAVENGHLEVVEALLEEGDADMGILNGEGRKPIDVAWESDIREALERRQQQKQPKEETTEMAIDESSIEETSSTGEWKEPLLLVNVATPDSTRWCFFGCQVDRVYAHLNCRSISTSTTTSHKRTTSTKPFNQRHPDTLIRKLSSEERGVLLSSPLMDRVPVLRGFLRHEGFGHDVWLLDKDGVYKAFSADKLSFGQVSVIYMDLQRLVPPTAPVVPPTSATLPGVPPNSPDIFTSITTTTVPLKVKMKMQRKMSKELPAT